MKILLSWRGRRAAFRYPVDPAPRTAVLEAWFDAPKRGSRIRIFEGADDAALERFAPQALAGSWERLERVSRGDRVSPTHGVVVLHRGADAALLSSQDRERLWRAFRVPVYEQIIGPRGVLLAGECAAHAGMHIESGELALDGYNVEDSRCACGRTGPRILAGEPVERLRSVAAQAR